MAATQEDMEKLQRGRPGRGRLLAVVAIVVVAVVLIAVAIYAGWLFPSASSKVKFTILGAGASFPCPLITKWSSEYVNATRAAASGPQVTINYNCVGSGAGVNQLIAKTVDFAGSDRPLSASQRVNATNSLHIPETLGAVVATYNVAGIGQGINLTGHVLGEIYLGKITRWSHVNITSLNPGVSLPDQPITTVCRADSSGTTFVWTSYLNLSNPGWPMSKVSTSITCPAGGLAAAQNAGVAGAVRTTPFSVGYVELAFAVQNSMNFAKIQNSQGNWILPSLAGVAAAAATFTNPPAPDGDWGSVNILNRPGAASYPISSLTYLLVYKELNVYGAALSQTRAQALVEFLWWAIHDGQNFSETLTYPKLPAAIVTLNEGAIRSMTFNGQPLHP